MNNTAECWCGVLGLREADCPVHSDDVRRMAAPADRAREKGALRAALDTALGEPGLLETRVRGMLIGWDFQIDAEDPRQDSPDISYEVRLLGTLVGDGWMKRAEWLLYEAVLVEQGATVRLAQPGDRPGDRKPTE